MIELPADAEPYADEYSDLSGPGCYCLELSPPGDVIEAWDREFGSRPEWLDDLADASRVFYCGASSDVMARLEDHRDADVRKTVLLRVCDIQALERAWFHDSTEDAFQSEYNLAVEIKHDYPEAFVLANGDKV